MEVFEDNCFGVVEGIGGVEGNVGDIGGGGLYIFLLDEIFVCFDEGKSLGELWGILGIDGFLWLLWVFWFLDCWVVKSVMRCGLLNGWLEGLDGKLVWENLGLEEMDDGKGREDWGWLECEGDEGGWENGGVVCWLKGEVE